MSQLKNIQDDSLPSWLPRLAGNKGPRFLQIADALQAALVAGSLKPGDRLPPQRLLAAQLDVDLTTITRAYDEARRRNLLEGRGARGTYVAAPKVESTAILDLSMNTPPPPDGVDFDDMLKQGLSQVLMRSGNETLMTYHLAGGSDSDRKAGAKWLAPMFGHLDARQLVVCPGAQAAIAALILALTEPGDVIMADPTTYPGLRAAATQFGISRGFRQDDIAGLRQRKDQCGDRRLRTRTDNKLSSIQMSKHRCQPFGPSLAVGVASAGQVVSHQRFIA